MNEQPKVKAQLHPENVDPKSIQESISYLLPLLDQKVAAMLEKQARRGKRVSGLFGMHAALLLLRQKTGETLKKSGVPADDIAKFERQLQPLEERPPLLFDAVGRPIN